jgi:hypothetical protein
MPIDIRVDSAERVRYSWVTGIVTDAEVIDAYDRVVDDPDFDPTLDVIADMTGVVRIDVTANRVRELAERRARNARLNAARPRVAIVAPTDVMFGIARMYESSGPRDDGSRRYLVCRTMEEARAWLSLPERSAQPDGDA